MAFQPLLGFLSESASMTEQQGSLTGWLGTLLCVVLTVFVGFIIISLQIFTIFFKFSINPEKLQNWVKN